jgi:hypothetical protein
LFFYCVPVTFLYYLLIDVKFWRSITRWDFLPAAAGHHFICNGAAGFVFLC